MTNLKLLNYIFKISRRFFLVLMVFSLSLTVNYDLKAQIRVFQLSDSNACHHKDGLMFSLPQTRVVVDVIIEKSVRIKGPFEEFAQDYIGTTDNIVDNGISYKISDIRITTVAEPDPHQLFLLDVHHFFPFFHKHSHININEQGILESINVPVKGKEQVPVKPAGFAWDHILKAPVDPESFVYHVNNYVIRPPKPEPEIQDTVFPPPMPKIIYANENKGTPLSEQAKDAAGSLVKIRESLQSLISGAGEVNYEKGTLKLMIDNLNKLEQDILRLFRGYEIETQLTYTFDLIPELKDTGNLFLFYFSPKSGVSVTDIKPDAQAVSLKFSKPAFVCPTEKPTTSKKSKPVSLGIPYRTPFVSECSILKDDKTEFTTSILINQFGKVAYLPGNTANVTFDPKTGGIIHLRLH